MDWKTLINDASLTIALVAVVAAETILVITSGTTGLTTTDLPAAALVLSGALAGTKIPKG